jgi:NAD(P)-dependent dehydrogenase (short-subunit alcohol dehydrogenase family)
MTFAGKTVAIYGAASDVGRACAGTFAQAGAHLFLIDEDEKALADIAATCGGAAVQSARAKLGDWKHAVASAEAFSRHWNTLDLLVTAPMALEFASIEASDPAAWQTVLGADLLGPIYATKAFLPLLKLASQSSIVHVGSVDGTLGNPTIPSYSVAKGGIAVFTHVSASEFGRFGIRVNCVARTMSADMAGMPDHVAQALLPHTPLGRISRSSELASVVHFLASPAAGYVSGVVIPVDGGRTAITPGTRPEEQSRFRAE